MEHTPRLIVQGLIREWESEAPGAGAEEQEFVRNMEVGGTSSITEQLPPPPTLSSIVRAMICIYLRQHLLPCLPGQGQCSHAQGAVAVQLRMVRGTVHAPAAHGNPGPRLGRRYAQRLEPPELCAQV